MPYFTAAYILNRVPSKSITTTPYELWTKRQPKLGHLRPWDSTAYIHDPCHKHEKLSLRGKKYIFIQYPKHSKGYFFIGENTDISIYEIESRDVNFLEYDFPTRQHFKKISNLWKWMILIVGAIKINHKNMSPLKTIRD